MTAHRQPLLLRLFALLWLVLQAASAQAQSEDVDPPGRVGRIAGLAGAVSWFDLEEGRWSEAVRNRPVTAGDRIATGRDARAELRIGSTTVKLGEVTELEMQRLDDERIRLQVHRGTVAVRLRSSAVAAETAFGTDEAWLQPQRGGLYRLERQDDTTWASAWRGELAVDGDPTLRVAAGQRLQLWREGADRRLRHRSDSPLDDAFAARVLREDRDDERSASAAHVSPEMTGFEDLDHHGRWDRHPEYGPVWLPTAVADDWVPYRDGRWVWVRPWGWTWIDDAPWGFAPFHYGRWAHWRGRWVWVPGAYASRPVYAPALVAWIDGPGLGIGLRWGGPSASWLPLAPWELYRPHHRVSPGYHDRINPPEHRRWKPPPRGDSDRERERPGHHAVPGAITSVGRDRLPTPRTPRPDDGDTRPVLSRPEASTGPAAPPPPRTPMVPLPSRPQPARPTAAAQPSPPPPPLPSVRTEPPVVKSPTPARRVPAPDDPTHRAKEQRDKDKERDDSRHKGAVNR